MNELTTTDPKNPHSLVNITPTSLSNAIKAVPESIWEVSEDDLRSTLKDHFPKQLANLEMLRESFWREFDQAGRAGRKINLSNICGGICTLAHFTKDMISNSHKVAFIVTPPKDYEVYMRMLQSIGLQQLEDIIRLPHVYQSGPNKGEMNPKAAHVKFMVIEQILLRVQGAVPYKIHTQNLNLNADVTQQQASNLPTNMEDLEARLRQLEKPADVVNEESVIDVSEEETKEEGI